ncbi:PGC-1 and ERR-induced regulator in muscle protein 1 [Trichomycterus rosablanca]|uniref:PGC-1 and ERR-induced regulator in muscle protein 1 n=1 Tax=Trichomycterus rosablanca TaxID=2290929 RepID=UPI002F3543A2
MVKAASFAMEDFEYSVQISELDWEAFFQVCEECNILPPVLAGLDDSGMSDIDERGNHRPRPDIQWQTHDPEQIDGPPDCDGSPVDSYLSIYGLNTPEQVLSGSEEDCHMETVNEFFERLKNVPLTRDNTDVSTSEGFAEGSVKKDSAEKTVMPAVPQHSFSSNLANEHNSNMYMCNETTDDDLEEIKKKYSCPDTDLFIKEEEWSLEILKEGVKQREDLKCDEQCKQIMQQPDTEKTSHDVGVKYLPVIVNEKDLTDPNHKMKASSPLALGCKSDFKELPVCQEQVSSVTPRRRRRKKKRISVELSDSDSGREGPLPGKQSDSDEDTHTKKVEIGIRTCRPQLSEHCCVGTASETTTTTTNSYLPFPKMNNTPVSSPVHSMSPSQKSDINHAKVVGLSCPQEIPKTIRLTERVTDSINNCSPSGESEPVGQPAQSKKVTDSINNCSPTRESEAVGQPTIRANFTFPEPSVSVEKIPQSDKPPTGNCAPQLNSNLLLEINAALKESVVAPASTTTSDAKKAVSVIESTKDNNLELSLTTAAFQPTDPALHSTFPHSHQIQSEDTDKSDTQFVESGAAGHRKTSASDNISCVTFPEIKKEAVFVVSNHDAEEKEHLSSATHDRVLTEHRNGLQDRSGETDPVNMVDVQISPQHSQMTDIDTQTFENTHPNEMNSEIKNKVPKKTNTAGIVKASMYSENQVDICPLLNSQDTSKIKKYVNKEVDTIPPVAEIVNRKEIWSTVTQTDSTGETENFETAHPGAESEIARAKEVSTTDVKVGFPSGENMKKENVEILLPVTKDTETPYPTSESTGEAQSVETVDTKTQNQLKGAKKVNTKDAGIPSSETEFLLPATEDMNAKDVEMSPGTKVINDVLSPGAEDVKTNEVLILSSGANNILSKHVSTMSTGADDIDSKELQMLSSAAKEETKSEANLPHNAIINTSVTGNPPEHLQNCCLLSKDKSESINDLGTENIENLSVGAKDGNRTDLNMLSSAPIVFEPLLHSQSEGHTKETLNVRSNDIPENKKYTHEKEVETLSPAAKDETQISHSNSENGTKESSTSSKPMNAPESKNLPHINDNNGQSFKEQITECQSLIGYLTEPETQSLEDSNSNPNPSIIITPSENEKHYLNSQSSDLSEDSELAPSATVNAVPVTPSSETKDEAQSLETLDTDTVSQPTTPVYAISSFWNEMEKLTINDILRLRQVGEAQHPSVLLQPENSSIADPTDAADSGYFTQFDEYKPDRSSGDMSFISDFDEDLTQLMNQDAKLDEDSQGSPNPMGIMWECDPNLSGTGTGMEDVFMLDSKTATLSSFHKDNSHPGFRKMCKNISIQNLQSLETQPLKKILRNASWHSIHSVYSAHSEVEDDSVDPFDRVETSSPVYLSDEEEELDNAGVTFSEILEYLFGAEEPEHSVSAAETVGTSYIIGAGSSVPEMYDHFFSEFEAESFFYPVAEDNSSNKDEMIPIFSCSRSSSKNLQFPEVYDSFFTDDSPVHSDEDEEPDHTVIRVITRHDHVSTKNQGALTAVDTFEEIFPEKDYTWNFMSKNPFSFRKIRRTGLPVPSERSNSWALTHVNNRTFQKRIQSIHALSTDVSPIPDPLLVSLENRIFRQLAVQQKICREIQNVVADPRVDAPLVSLKQADMCLVCIAFASWVLKSVNPQGADNWKAVLLANISALSAIRYLRRFTRDEAAKITPLRQIEPA